MNFRPTCPTSEIILDGGEQALARPRPAVQLVQLLLVHKKINRKPSFKNIARACVAIPKNAGQVGLLDGANIHAGLRRPTHLFDVGQVGRVQTLP